MARSLVSVSIYILAVWLFGLANCLHIEFTPCDIVGSTDRLGYEGDVVNNELLRPKMMTIDYATNTLFLSYTVAGGDLHTVSRYVDLKTKDHGDIKGIKNAFAHAVDTKNHIVYIGGEDGIYTFDFKTKKGTKISTQKIHVWNMFYKDKLYVTDLYFVNTHRLYTFEDGQVKPVEAFEDKDVSIIAVDKSNNVFFSNDTGLFKYDIDFKEGKYLGSYAVNSITTDVNGDVYFSTPSSINKIESDAVKQLFKFKRFIFGVVVEADGTIMYSDEEKVYRLKPRGNKCPEA